MGLFMPKTYVDSVVEITPEWMEARGLRALFLDIDDTLSPHGQKTPPEEIKMWVKDMRLAGFTLIAFSNNSEQRVGAFARILEIPYVFDATKPLPFKLSAAVKVKGLAKRETAMVGDQIFTDMLGANLAGVFSVLVLPGSESLYGFTRFKRKIENFWVKRLKRRGKR